jgi:anaerobic magnesium-protoporphyrin IX monomethyl ester cyclase
LQFSRGCTLHCTYCGQWGFWRRWRHHSPGKFADELETLARHHGVRIVWLADENFAADREMARQALEHLAARQLDLSLNLNMTAADVVRDADLLPLYKRAGVDNIIMGIETLDDKIMAKVRKNNPIKTSRQAVRLLRQHGIVSLVNIIYGLEDENFSTIGLTFRQLFRLDPDVINAVYITPHFWTQMGREFTSEQIIEPNQARWTYRNQVVLTPHLAPWQLFLSVKLTETLFHLRPRALWRMVLASDRRYRRILRAYLTTGARVVLAEIGEFLFNAPPVPARPPTYTPRLLKTS